MPPAPDLSPLTGCSSFRTSLPSAGVTGPRGSFGPMSVSSSSRAPGAARGQQRGDWRREGWEEEDGLERLEWMLVGQRNRTRFLLAQERETVAVQVARQGQFWATGPIPKREPAR